MVNMIDFRPAGCWGTHGLPDRTVGPMRALWSYAVPRPKNHFLYVAKSLINLATRAGFEPATNGLTAVRRADFVVDSSQGFDHTRAQIRDILRSVATMRRW